VEQVSGTEKSLFITLPNHQASASHNGTTVSSAFLIPSAKALALEHAISRSRSPKARLRERNSKNSTSPARIGDVYDVTSLFIGIDDSFLLPKAFHVLVSIPEQYLFGAP
jgi:hypothetical protein